MVLQKKTSILLMLVAVSLMIMSPMSTSFAQQSGMTITATVQEKNVIQVTGHTTSKIHDITIKVETPNKSVIAIDQIKPDESGYFKTSINLGEQLLKQDGRYTIIAHQGAASIYNLSIKIQAIGGTIVQTEITESTSEKIIQRQIGNQRSFTGLEIQADAMPGSTTITVFGNTDRLQQPITLKVAAPNQNIIAVDQISPNVDGTFSTNIITGSELWKQDGNYTITAQQGEVSSYKDKITVEIKDGAVIPEFGTIAALVLAVAIISIIAVSARSRLSIMPKY